MSDSEVVKGSCLCKAVQYECPKQALVNVLCHCNNCKKATGSVFGANSMHKTSDLNIKSGTEKLRTYSDKDTASGNVINRRFCSDCGSLLFIEGDPNEAGVVVVTSGTLEYDHVKDWRPNLEFFCQNRMEFLPEVSDTKKRQAMI